MTERYDHADGFALVDVLVALTIAGLATSILVGLVAFADRTKQNIREEAQLTEDITAIDAVLRTLAEEPTSMSATETNRPHGDPTEFSVPTTGPRILNQSQPVLFKLRSEDIDAQRRIVLIWRDAATGQERLEGLSSLFKSATFSYFGQRSGSEDHAWYPSWRPNSGRLEAVRLTLSAASLHNEIELIVPLRGDVPLDCLRKPHQAACFWMLQ
ncbi:hypothetical protein [Microvirga terricola]|uniref:General secretion pathway protein J n=1 Tax=Microvirga terricola TaxID=2719797 RepID=A0ABX0VI57_9HYPH|nr:hypothetical protein [Microvirga terricola]NIX78436.1 hypothetical protein [Microvirga terricola]